MAAVPSGMTMAQVQAIIQPMVGSLLIGGIVSVMLSGVTLTQTVIYIRSYAYDAAYIKLIVFVIWLLDTTHSTLIAATMWFYFIEEFGNIRGVDVVPISLALTVAITALLTFIVQMFFVHRIYILSKNNYYIAIPLALLTATRPGFAFYATNKVIAIGSFTKFSATYGWTFTVGLSLAAIGDLLITAFMCWVLKRQQKKYSSMNKVLDTLILYALENGLLPALVATVSLILWLTQDNLIFAGVHFTILKLYANCLLATLNARQDLKAGRITLHTTHLGDSLGNGTTTIGSEYSSSTSKGLSKDLDTLTHDDIEKPGPLKKFHQRTHSQLAGCAPGRTPIGSQRTSNVTGIGGPRFIAQPIVLPTTRSAANPDSNSRSSGSIKSDGALVPHTLERVEWENTSERGSKSSLILEELPVPRKLSNAKHPLKIRVNTTQVSVTDKETSARPSGPKAGVVNASLFKGVGGGKVLEEGWCPTAFASPRHGRR